MRGKPNNFAATPTFDRAAVELLLSHQVADAAQPAMPPVARKRRPLPEAFQVAAHELVKAAEKLGRLINDDRFPRNAEQAARVSRHDLLRASDLLAEVVGRINASNKEGS